MPVPIQVIGSHCPLWSKVQIPNPPPSRPALSHPLTSELCAHLPPWDPHVTYSSRYVRPGGGFVPNFQLFEKGDVNGEKEQKFYTFLKVSGQPPVQDPL